MADDQIEGLPEGATVRPIQQPQQATTTDPNQVEGLPEGATVRPLSSPPAAKSKTTATPSGLSDSIDTSLSTNPAYQTGKAIYKGARGLYHGVVGDEETQESKGTPTGTAGSPNNPAGVANYGLTPEHVGHELGSTGRSIGEFGAGVAKDLGVGGPGLPAVVPNEKGVGISDPKANTLLGKYVMAPSQAEREQSKNEFQKYFETNGAEAAGHALAGFIHGTLGEYVPAVGPIASTIMQQAANGDIGGALSQIAALYGTEEAAGKIKEGIKGRVADLHAKLTPDTPEVAQAKANVESLAKDREVAQKAYDKAAAEDQKHAASHAQGVSSPEKVTKALAKSKLELDEATFHHESAIEHAKQLAASQPNLAQRTGTAVGKTIAKVLPTPEAPAEIPAEKIETAPQEPVLQKLGQPKPAAPPINVKTPGQVQPETFPQEPTETPRTPIGRIQLPNEQGTVGTPRQLTEGTPEGPQVPPGGLPKIKPVQEVLPPEKPAPKPERGNVKALTVDEKGNVIDKENTPEMKLQKLLEESLKNNTETKPAAKTEEKAPVENRAGERRQEEVPVAEERRTGDRRNAAGVRVDENGDPVMSPDVQGHWQQGVFGEKPAEDIGAKARAANPEPTRAETKAAALPKEEPTGYAAKKEEVVPAGSEGREPATPAAEYHPEVRQRVFELGNEDLKALARAHGLNPDAPEYAFGKGVKRTEATATSSGRQQTGRAKLADDVTAQMSDDEKINIGRNARTMESEGTFKGQDVSNASRAEQARKLFPRLNAEETTGGYGSKNTGVTREAYEAARKAAQEKLGGTLGMNGGNLPIKEWATQAKYHFEAGAREFVDWSKNMVEDAGEAVRPYLQKLWAEVNKGGTDAEAAKPDLKKVVSDYSKQEGLEPVKDNKIEVDPRSKEIARAYDDMKHDPSNPEVKKSYSALIDDAKKQWDALTKAGIKLEPQDEDPYKSYDEMKKDFNDNKRLKVWRGGNELPKDHPLAKVDPKTGETYNVMFRAVHDAIGHLLHDNDFSEKGESNAFDTHRQTMSKEAVPAMTTETKGQNSWVMNHGGSFEGMEQKAGILPERFVEDAPDPKAVLDHLKSGKDYALLTAENPNNERATPEQNAQKNREMKAELEKMGYKPTPIEGHVKDVEGQKENSFFVPDISPEDAAKVSRKFGQASVMTKQGIHDLVKNTVHPSGEVLEGPEAAKQDYHSTVAGKPFSVSVDFGKEEEPLTKPTFKTTNRHAEDLSYEHKPEGIENSNQQHRVTTKDENGKKVGEVSAQDTADGEVTVRSDQVYDKNLRGSGRGYDQMKHLLDSVDENTHTVRSDISNSNAEKGVWSKLAADYPEAISKKTFKDGQVQYSVDMDKYREGGTGPGGEQSVGSAKAGTKMAKGEPLTPEKLQERLPDLAQKHLTQEEKDSITTTATGKPRSAGTAKFIQNMTNIPTVQEYVDIALQGEGAKDWYSRSTRAFDAVHEAAPDYFKEGDKEKFMGLLAGSSPQQSVAMNLRETLGFWKEWVDAGRPELSLDKWQKFGDIADEAWKEDGSPRAGGTMKGASKHWDYAPKGDEWKAENLLLKNLTLPDSKVPNIIKALNGEPMWPDLTKNSAFKAPSFAENLRKWINGKSTGTKNVTNDSWMGLFGGIDKHALSSPENYHPLSVAARAAAEELGWEPEQAQAAIWSFTQALTEKGVEDPELVRHYSEDFKDLLENDVEVREQLEGLGVNLDQLDRKLDAIGEKPKVSGRSTPTTAHSVGQLKSRIEEARGKGAIPEPKSVQGSFFRENPAFEHKAKPGEGHVTQPRDEATRFDPKDFEDETSGSLEKLGKKKSRLGSIK